MEMEANYGGTGWLPPEHVHPRQVERFEVLDGTMRTIIGGTERRYGPGETFEVPAGTPHQMRRRHTGTGITRHSDATPATSGRPPPRRARRTASLAVRLC